MLFSNTQKAVEGETLIEIETLCSSLGVLAYLFVAVQRTFSCSASPPPVSTASASSFTDCERGRGGRGGNPLKGG